MKVLSVNQMQKLKELGIDTSKASIRVGRMIFTQSDPWYGKEEYDVYLFDHEDNDTDCFVEEYRTFTLQDIIELLQGTKSFYFRKECENFYLKIEKFSDTNYSISYENSDHFIVGFSGSCLLTCAYNMLIWVAENGYLKTK